jgi:hypothetical protein
MVANFISSIKNYNKYALLLCFFYLLAHGGILFIPNAIYWDDWVLYRNEKSVILDMFRQAGSMFNFSGYLHIGLLEIGPWIYKWLTFILMFASGLLLNEVVKRYGTVSETARFFIILLFLILPFNMARIALIDFPYTLCYFMFFLAWALMDRFRLFALVLFFLSFNTNSLLVFYAIPFFDMFYRSGYLNGWRNVIKFGVRHIDYILLPFIYFFIKIYFFSPSGDYENYNEIYSLENIISSARLQYTSTKELFYLYKNNLFLNVIFTIVTFLLLRSYPISKANHYFKNTASGVLGIIILLLGVFPYWIVGHTPSFDEWTSRHQILMPLGCSLILVAVWSYLNASRVFISVIVGISLGYSVATYKDFFFDWQKQQQLISIFAKTPEIKNGCLIVIDDRTIAMNAINRSYRFYEWNGIFEVAFGDQKRFGISKQQLPGYLSGEYKDNLFTSNYKAASFKRDTLIPPVNVEINLLEIGDFSERFRKLFSPQYSISGTAAILKENN